MVDVGRGAKVVGYYVSKDDYVKARWFSYRIEVERVWKIAMKVRRSPFKVVDQLHLSRHVNRSCVE